MSGSRPIDRPLRRLLTAGALAALLATGLPAHVSDVAAQPDDPELPALGPLRVSRVSTGYQVAACLLGFDGRGSALEQQPNTLRLHADGELVLAADAQVRFALPPIGVPADPDDPCDRSLHFFSLRLQLTDIADSGVAMPDPGQWTSFELRVELEIDGHRLVGDRTVDIGAGEPFGEFSGVVPTPAGARLRGWIVDPEGGARARYRVTVEGHDFPELARPPDPQRRAGDYARHGAGGAGTTGWEERELGPDHALDAVVPFGRICVHMLIDPDLPLSEGFRSLGCRTTFSGVPTGGIDSVTPREGGARIRAHYFNPWMDLEDDAPVVFLTQDDGKALMVTPTTRRNLPSEYGEVTGWFEIDADMTLRPGRRTVCLRAMGKWSPWMYWPVTETSHDDEDLDCRTVQVPHLPEGETRFQLTGRRLTVSGGAVDLNGGSPLVLVTSNGTMRAATRANRPSADIQRKYGGDGRSAFNTVIDLPPGTHRVCTAFEDTTDGRWTAATCSKVVVK